MVTPTQPAPARDEASIHRELSRLERPLFVVSDGDGVAVTTDEPVARRSVVLAAVPPLCPESLGDRDFRQDHGVRYAYQAGAMANGIASARMVAALTRAGYLASFGAAGLRPVKVGEALAAIRRAVPGKPFACNLIHTPGEPDIERAIVDLCLEHEVRCVEASAFLDLTPQLVRYRLAGLTRDGLPRNRVIAKVSRPEVAEHFLRPAPPHLVRALVGSGELDPDRARLAARVPMADDITAEADSGGHTDGRPLVVLLPELLALRDRVHRDLGYSRLIRVGAAGGIGTPLATAGAFALGAAYVVTGSINQASVEADQSEEVKRLLAQAGPADCGSAPSADMFEMGVTVQVLKRGTMFAGRAKRLYEAYRNYDGLDALPAAERDELERRVFRKPLDEVWADCVRFFAERDPAQLDRAAADAKHRMALVFRWYLGRSSAWGVAGLAERALDYQIWCGPAMGAFNGWAEGTRLAALANRRVAELAAQIMRGAAFSARISQLRYAGVRLPPTCSTYRP